MNIFNYCLVSECRFKFTHTTFGHKCGKCGVFKHGILECNNEMYKNNLLTRYSDFINIEDRCTIRGCNNDIYHTIEGHNCNICNKRVKHSDNDCLLNKNNFRKKCPICRTLNTFNKDNINIIKGINDKCSICYDNNVSVIFSNCDHCPCCFDCFNKLDYE